MVGRRGAGDLVWGEGSWCGGAARTAALEPRLKLLGECVAGEAFEPDRPTGQATPGRARPSHHDVSAIALVQALRQGEVRDAALVQRAQPGDLATLERVTGAQGLSGAQAARRQAGPCSVR